MNKSPHRPNKPTNLIITYHNRIIESMKEDGLF